VRHRARRSPLRALGRVRGASERPGGARRTGVYMSSTGSRALERRAAAPAAAGATAAAAAAVASCCCGLPPLRQVHSDAPSICGPRALRRCRGPGSGHQHARSTPATCTQARGHPCRPLQAR